VAASTAAGFGLGEAVAVDVEDHVTSGVHDFGIGLEAAQLRSQVTSSKVFLVALDCVEAMEPRATSMVQSTATAQQMKVPAIFWTSVIDLASRGGLSSGWSACWTLAP
jgi:hypothetical protein